RAAQICLCMPVPWRTVAGSLIRTLRQLRAGLFGAARQVPRRRAVTLAVVAAILVAVALAVPLPTAVQLRDWAHSLGPWFPFVFLVTHAVVTVLPIPRSAFTLAAGLLFGSALGIALAVTASTISAVLALLLVRAAGWQLGRLVSHPAVDGVDAHLRR